MDVIVNRLKLMRSRMGLTQEEVAEKVGVSRQAVAKWEKGETLPDIESCIKLADLFEVPVDMLVRGLKEEKTAEKKQLFGCVKVNDKGQITLPVSVREAFRIKQGDYVLVLADTEKGIALMNMGSMEGDENFPVMPMGDMMK